MENISISCLLMAACTLNYKSGETGCRGQGEGFSTPLFQSKYNRVSTLTGSMNQSLEYVTDVRLLLKKEEHI